ncbi:MAG: GspH/FimT family pseudopilin [Pseudomonadaceae bacterium]|nr:GspH/FimT family pseudopilin [Pseudomonadaceae bacterium]
MATRGYTIAELLAVTSLIALAALIISPSSSSHEDAAAARAAETVAQALAFARDESIRTTSLHQVEITQSTELTVQLMSRDEPPIPAGIVTKPTTRQPFELNLRNSTGASTLTSVARFATDDGQIRTQILFDGHGLPKHIDASGHALLTGGEVIVANGNSRLRVTLAPMTGRVTIERI